VVPRHGAWEVLGWEVAFLSSASLLVTVVLSTVTGVVAYREYREGRFGLAQFPRFAATFMLTFLLGSKVLSPQYMSWLLPLVPLGVGGIWGTGASAVFLAICWMTTLIYPYHYLEVAQGHFPRIEIFLGRNLLLVVLWGLILPLALKSESARDTMQKTAAGQDGT
jgi:hypothetical protein